MDIFLGNRRCEMVCYAILDVVVMTVIDILKGRYLDIYFSENRSPHLNISLDVLLQTGEEQAAAEEVHEVCEDVEGEEPGGAPHPQPPLDAVTCRALSKS